jgi:hypothetical protein
MNAILSDERSALLNRTSGVSQPEMPKTFRLTYEMPAIWSRGMRICPVTLVSAHGPGVVVVSRVEFPQFSGYSRVHGWNQMLG